MRKKNLGRKNETLGRMKKHWKRGKIRKNKTFRKKKNK